MPYKDVQSLGLASSNEDRLLFEVRWLSERVRNLELIVHELMRGRVNKEIADGWTKSSVDRGWTPSINQIEGRGEQIAFLLDQVAPDKSGMQWPSKKPL